MDLGTGGWTSFRMDESVSAYMAEHIELFECDLGLVHSHHTMGAFFSGQDTYTLNKEGNDTNCFVSLIVDTAGTYKAAVTRKVQSRTEVIRKTLGTSYEFFGEGTKILRTPSESINTSEPVVNTTEFIEYFMLDVHRDQTYNPLDYLDERFREIEASKKASLPKPINVKVQVPKDNMTFREWLDAPKDNELTLWDKKTMDEMIEPKNWTPDPDVIHKMAAQLLVCSLIIDPSKFDLKKWVDRYMESKYKQIFPDNLAFDMWSEFIVEFLLNSYNEEGLPEDFFEEDAYKALVAEALIEELLQYEEVDGTGNIRTYCNVIEQYT